MDPLNGRMDFEFENLSKDLVQVIEDTVNREIQKGHPVKVKILPRVEAFQIPDLIRTKINLLPPQISEIRTKPVPSDPSASAPEPCSAPALQDPSAQVRW